MYDNEYAPPLPPPFPFPVELRVSSLAAILQRASGRSIPGVTVDQSATIALRSLLMGGGGGGSGGSGRGGAGGNRFWPGAGGMAGGSGSPIERGAVAAAAAAGRGQGAPGMPPSVMLPR